MDGVEDLVVGKFYWVMPVADPDKEAEWEDGLQPARFNGRNADGVPLWNCLGIDGNSDWPMRWVGAEIIAD